MGSNQPRPPRVARRLLTALLHDEPGRDIRADLSEEFEQIAAREGTRAARGWYQRQVARSVGARMAGAVARLAGLVTGAPAGLARLARIGGDLGPATRSLRRVPWYSATIVAVVALSIALSTTVFAVVDGVLFRPLPYADADELVAVDLGFFRDGVLGGRVRPEDLDAWQAGVPDVPLSSVRVVDVTGLERVNEAGLGLALVRPNLLDVLGVKPLLGGFSPDHLELARLERPPMRPVLISYDLWQQRFAGETAVVGRLIDPVDPTATPLRIAGVLPPGFAVPAVRAAELVMPSADGHARSLRDTTVIARLPDDVASEAFRGALEAAMRRAEEARGYDGRGARPDRAVIRPLGDALGDVTGPVMRGLFAAAAMLVLIACLNVSGLMTARCLDRGREIGLRRAIGARPSDVARVLLVEHAILFTAGMAIGVAATAPLLRLVVGLLPPTLHLLKTPVLDLRVMAFGVIAMAVSLAVASVWPVRRALAPSLQQVIAGDGGGAVTPRAAGLGSTLVTVGQVSGAIVLVLAGGLLVGSLLQVKANEIGYDVDRVVVAELGIAPWLDGDPAWNRRPDIKLRLDAFLGDLRRHPDVAAAGAADVDVLIGRLIYSSRFDPLDRPPDPDLPPGHVLLDDAGGLKVPVTAGFFQATGIRPLEGRLPTDEELTTGAPVVAVSRSFARRNFPDASPVGDRLRHTPAGDYPAFEIVGVVEDPRLGTWDGAVSSTVFASYATFGGNPNPVLFVHAEQNMPGVMAEIVWRAEAERPILRPVRVQTAEAMLGETIRDRRLLSWLFGSFAVAGLVLTGIGLFGLVAMAMARRTREVGIRIALGATRDRLVRGIVREQLTPVLLGIVLGGVLAAWLVRFLESYLFELSVFDARVWGVAIAVVTATTLGGALIPSWRASRVDPVRALRVE
jgi:predicted permease